MAKNNGIEFRVKEAELKALIKKVRSLDPILQEKIFRKGLGKAGKKMLSTAQRLAPVDRNTYGERGGKVRQKIKFTPTKSGGVNLKGTRIKDRFSMSVKRTKDGKMMKAFVRNKAPHAHLMEYGFWLTKGKFVQRKIKFVGPHPAQGFMRPALHQNADLTVNEFISNTEEAMKKLESKTKVMR